MPFAFRPPSLFLRASAAAFAAVLLGSCSGSVDPSPNVVDPTAITIQPPTAILYSGLPTEFIISGGTGQYVVTSSNQAAVPIAVAGVGKRLVVIPNNVITETPVTLTVRDTSVTPQATAALTVRPGTVNNAITITPSPQNASCSPGICTANDALVSATLSQGAIPLPARGVRFEVVSGDFRFITTPPGVTPEQTALSIDVITDQVGRAQARIRVLAGVRNQTALFRVTDLGSGAFQNTSFQIVQFTGNAAGFFVVPDAFTFVGPRENVCASGGTVSFAVFGGVPPYTIVNTSAFFNISPVVVGASGGVFNASVRSDAGCVENAPIAITDATGRTITATLSNVQGTGEATSIVVAPLIFEFTSCTSTGSATAAGGTGVYSAASSNAAITATVSGRTITLRRVRAGAAPETPPPATVQVGVTDGLTSQTIVVTLSGAAAGICP